MKTKLLLFGMCTVLIFACKKKEDKTNNPTISNLGMSCNVDGVAWGADKDARYVIDGDSLKGVKLEYDPYDSSMSVLAFRIVNGDTTAIVGDVAMPPTMIGTYTLSFAEDSYSNLLYVKKLVPGSIFNSYIYELSGYFGDDTPGTQVGVFKVTSYDPISKKMSAEFNFNQISSPDANPSLPTITVTNGKIENVIVEMVD